MFIYITFNLMTGVHGGTNGYTSTKPTPTDIIGVNNDK